MCRARAVDGRLDGGGKEAEGTGGAIMGKPARIELGNSSSGICIEYIKSRNVLWIWGWYDGMVGIQGTEIPLDEFCQRLGIRQGAMMDRINSRTPRRP